jgi:2-haloacid dehalogenase
VNDHPPPIAPVQAVVFDLGGVLLDWNPRYLYRRLIDDEREMERFLAEICTLEWHAAHDLGVPFARSLPELAAAHPEHAELIHAWGERSEEMIGGAIEDTVTILADLRARGVPCYALTNMEAETYPLRRARFDFLRWFDGTVVSSAERVAKPDPEIFRRLLARYELIAEHTVMVDDRQDNVTAAREVGMQAVRFRSAAGLRRWLAEAGLLPEPDPE